MTGDPALPGEPSGQAKKKLLFFVLAAGCLLIVLFVPNLAGGSRSGDQLNDFAHLPIFAVLTLALAALSPSRPVRLLDQLRWGLRLFALSLLLGTLVELLQGRMGRMAELSDVMRDAGGSCAALLILLSRRPGLSTFLRRTIRLTASMIPMIFLLPLSVDLADEIQARRQFPMLADFESSTQLRRFKPLDCRLERASDTKHPHQHLLKATFNAGLYPRVELRYFPGDWRGYGSFAFTCINPETTPVKLFLRINDRRHDKSYRDRYNVTLSLPPGRQEILIPLREVEQAPLTRRMEMDSIVSANFYLFRLKHSHTLFFDNLRLMPARKTDSMSDPTVPQASADR
ncbi:MAG: hypothetical protein ACE5ID_07465 [Acidobacteriota bacterium]